MDPCPACGALLVAPEAGPAGKNRFPTVDTGLQTHVVGDGTPPPDEPPEQRAQTAADGDVHELPTVADEAAPALLALAAAPPPDTAEMAAADSMVEDTATETTPSPPDTNSAPDTDEVSPFVDDSVDQASLPDAGAEVLTKTGVQDSLPEVPAKPAAHPRADSPDVYTRTIAEEHVAQQEAAAPSADSLPPLPVPRTPKPPQPAAILSPGAPPGPRSSSKPPPRPAKPSGAPPIPGRAASAGSRSGVVSSAPPMPGVMSSAAPQSPQASPPAPVAPDVGSRSGVVSSAPPIPGIGPASPLPGAAASGRPSDVLPRPPAGGRPSDVLPRPPASAVVRPGLPPGVVASPQPPPVQGQPPPSGMPNQMPPGMVASPPPSGAPGAVPPMMQSYPTPSNVAHPPAPGMTQSPAPPYGSDASMAAMPAAYALPGSGYPVGVAPVANTPQPPLVHTPIPPGLIGPPPDLNESSSLGAALDSLDHQNERARQDTPSANAVWRTAHPSAQKWAAKRHGGAVRTPKPGIIAIGLMLAGFGAYLLAIFLPTKQPLTAAKIEELSKQAGVDEHAWHFSEQLIDAANINAALFVLLGVVIVLRGAMYRQQPPGHARKGLSKPAVMLIFCFALLAVSFGALVMSASA